MKTKRLIALFSAIAVFASVLTTGAFADEIGGAGNAAVQEQAENIENSNQAAAAQSGAVGTAGSEPGSETESQDPYAEQAQTDAQDQDLVTSEDAIDENLDIAPEQESEQQQADEISGAATAAPETDSVETGTGDPAAEAGGTETQGSEENAAVDSDAVTKVKIDFTMVLDGWPRYGTAVFNLFTEDGEMVGSHTLDIRTIEDFSLEYDVPPAPVGTIYYLETSGLDSIDYYEDNYIVPGERLPIYTYYSAEAGEDGTRDIIAEAAMTAHMRTQDPINIYVDGVKVELSSPAIFDGSSILAPLSEVSEAIGVSDCTYWPDYNSVKANVNGNEILVNIGYSYMTVFGTDVNLNHPVDNINSLTYIELRPYVEAWGSTLEYSDNGDYYDINLTKSPMAVEYITSLENRINESGVSSSTDYLIWVNKSTFTCTVFQGSAGNWKWLKNFTVGIGANGTETITGQYEYNQYVNMWPYANYYCGPVMIFYGGYALHSTLLKYDGTPYNNSVGVKISLGCIRCQPRYINWMASTVPMYSKVYITES